MKETAPASTRTWWDLLVEALSESPVVRPFEALCAWAEQPEGRAVLLAIQEWATVDCRLQEHRRRWQQDGIPISTEEAEYALRCLGWAAFNEQLEPAQYLAHTLENNPSGEVFARYIERAESEAPYWDALVSYKESHGGDISPMLSEWPSKGAKRPHGRGRPGRPRRWIFRDEVLIPEAIRKLEGCGLPVTSEDGRPSIAAAVAKVFCLTERNVAAIWESAPNRSDKHSRRRYSNQLCRKCKRPEVPMYRHRRREFLCEVCLPGKL